MKIIIDIDDTLVGLTEPWIEQLNKKYNLNVKPEEITDWDMKIAFPNLSYSKIYNVICKRDFWNHVFPKKDSTIYLKKLVDEGHQIYLCTSTHFSNVKYKYEQVISRYFPYIAWKNIIITGDKSIIAGDIMIDDNMENIENSICKHRLLMDACHNHKFNYKDRVYNWKNIYEKVKEISIGKEY